MFGWLLWFRRFPVVVHLLITLVGLTLVLLSTGAKQAGHWATGLFSLGTAFIAGAVLAFIQEAFGTDVPTIIEQRLGISRKLYDAGLEDVILHSSAQSSDSQIFKKFPTASSIDLVYNTAMSTVYRHGWALAKAAVTRGCHVRIIVSDPQREFWQDEALKNGLCPGLNIAEEISNVLSHLRQAVSDAAKVDATDRFGSIEVRKMPCVPTTSIVLVDDEVANLRVARSSHAILSKAFRGELLLEQDGRIERQPAVEALES